MNAVKAMIGVCFLIQRLMQRSYMRSPTEMRGVIGHSLVFKSGRSGSKIGPIAMAQARLLVRQRRVAFRQHLPKKPMSLQFAPLFGHVLIKDQPSRAWLCNTLRWSLWRRRNHEPAAIYDSGAGVLRIARSRGGSCRLAGRLRFGRHREHRRSADRE